MDREQELLLFFARRRKNENLSSANDVKSQGSMKAFICQACGKFTDEAICCQKSTSPVGNEY